MCMCIKSVKRKFLRLKPNLQPKSWEDAAAIEPYGLQISPTLYHISLRILQSTRPNYQLGHSIIPTRPSEVLARHTNSAQS